jgi:ABC-type uncharacterized transport system substrate-binding protein
LELLKEAVPRLSTVAVISNPDHPMNRLLARKLEDIAQTRGLKVRIFYVRGPESLDNAFGQAGRVAQAVLVLSIHTCLTISDIPLLTAMSPQLYHRERII